MTALEELKEMAFNDGWNRETPRPPQGQESFYAFWYKRGVDAENAQSAASEIMIGDM